jgi:hypothetical protein
MDAVTTVPVGERALLEEARGGSEDAYRRLVEPHRAPRPPRISPELAGATADSS